MTHITNSQLEEIENTFIKSAGQIASQFDERAILFLKKNGYKSEADKISTLKSLAENYEKTISDFYS